MRYSGLRRSVEAGLLLLLLVALSGCSSTPGKLATDQSPTSIDAALAKLSLPELEEAALVFKVAFEKSTDSWQGPIDEAVPGCKINALDAENGIAALKPWLVRRSDEEAKKLLSSPKTHQLPVASDGCEQSCTCGLGARILAAANLENESHSKVKDLKRLRARFEAKAELMTSERAELCSEGAKWICSSDLLKAIKAMSGKAK